MLQASAGNALGYSETHRVISSPTELSPDVEGTVESERTPSPPSGHRIPYVSRCLSWPRSSVYRAIKCGELPAVRLSTGTLVVLDDDLRDFIAARRTVPGQGKK